MGTQLTLARVGRQYPVDLYHQRDGTGAMDALGLSMSQGVRRTHANDYFSNAAARMGWGTPSLTEATEYDLVRLSFNYTLMYTLYRNHWIARRIVDAPAFDMVRAWPRLTSELEPKHLTKIDCAIRDTLVKPKILKALTWARLFGGAGALMIIEGQDHQLDKPLDIDSVGIGAFKGLIPFDMWSGIHPGAEISDDITKPLEFGLPTHYRVNVPNGAHGFDVHSSRILRFCGPEVPTPEHQAQMYWGISVLEVIYEELRKRDNLSWNMLSLTYRANLIGIEYPELSQALSGAGMNQGALEQFYGRMQAVNELMSNQSLIMLPKEGKLQGLMYPFTGLADVLQQFQLDIAGAAELPVTKLFGRTLTGLGQSNDADIEMYEQKIAMEQTVNLEPQLNPLYRVICMSELGEVPSDLGLKFPSVRVLDEKQKSDLAKSTGDAVVSVYGAGILTKPQALRELKQSSEATGVFTNITDEDIEKAEEEDALAMELGLPTGPGEEPTGKSRAQTAADSAEAFAAFAGMAIYIECAAGERRVLRNRAGEVVYDRVLVYPYGYLRDTTGRDGDEIDVILGPSESSNLVFVADMQDLGPDIDQRQDEDKVLLGFPESASAVAAFESMYPTEWLRHLTEIKLTDFQNVDFQNVFVGKDIWR